MRIPRFCSSASFTASSIVRRRTSSGLMAAGACRAASASGDGRVVWAAMGADGSVAAARAIAAIRKGNDRVAGMGRVLP